MQFNGDGLSVITGADAVKTFPQASVIGGNTIPEPLASAIQLTVELPSAGTGMG